MVLPAKRPKLTIIPAKHATCKKTTTFTFGQFESHHWLMFDDCRNEISCKCFHAGKVETSQFEREQPFQCSKSVTGVAQVGRSIDPILLPKADQRQMLDRWSCAATRRPAIFCSANSSEPERSCRPISRSEVELSERKS